MRWLVLRVARSVAMLFSIPNLINYTTMATATISPSQVDSILKKHILKDGYDMVMDLERSNGYWLYDSKHERQLLDFFTCFATIPLGYNHPAFRNDPQFLRELMNAAIGNPSNSDIYTVEYARFLETFSRVAVPSYMKYAFFIAGGSLAVENAMKVAMDWKVQKNFAKGYRRELGTKVLHFEQAFHGRSGYTMSLTNTDPAKTALFAKFEDWPRVSNPKIVFPYTDAAHEDLLKREALAVAQIERAFAEHKDEICAIIIEPIQAEGGDNHFRKEFFVKLRQLCDQHEAMLIYDEVQMGVGCTGTFWCHDQFGPDARPDLIAFAKKMQVCGILCGPRVDEVEHNVFTTPSRINSTWGGNLVDMVRAEKILSVIEQDNLCQNAAEVGAYFLERLAGVREQFPQLVTNVRGRGLIVAFDLPDTAHRNQFIQKGLHDHQVMFLGAGSRTIRFRPALTMDHAGIDLGIEAIQKVLLSLGK